MSPETARLLISCPDQRGIIAAVAGFIQDHGGNILEADQHTDPEFGEFFMRVEVELDGFNLHRGNFQNAWQALASRLDIRWRVYWGDQVKRMAILVSTETHCLNDLLWRWRTGELPVEIAFVAGNHEAVEQHVDGWGVAFHHIAGTPETRSGAEARLAALLADAEVDLVVLARYMQILSPELVARYSETTINIHHSFLPAFAGPRPYHQAFARGVKIIGATSHYVTEELDQGPIIAQATTPVGHRDTVDDLIRKGRDLERVVLATAVRQHLEDKILVSQNKTVVFD